VLPLALQKKGIRLAKKKKKEKEGEGRARTVTKKSILVKGTNRKTWSRAKVPTWGARLRRKGEEILCQVFTTQGKKPGRG